jgi:hypothetical protein
MIPFTAMDWSATRTHYRQPASYFTHPAYTNLRQRAWVTGNTGEEYVARLNQLLRDFHAQVVTCDVITVLFEFDTQEDLTQFVLSWS